MLKLLLRFLAGLFVLQRLAAADGVASLESFDATTAPVGPGAGGWVTPVNQLVTPAGVWVDLPGVRPNAVALSPDGRLLVTSGLTNRLLVLDAATGEIRQSVRFPSVNGQTQATAPVSAQILGMDKKAKLSFTGLVFAPDGSRIYLSNVNGDIKVFTVNPAHAVAAWRSFPLPPSGVPGRAAEIPTGLAVSPDGSRLYVALNVGNRLAELDAASGAVLRTWNAGVAPFDVALAGRKAYVSNWGGRRPEPDSVTGPIGETGWVRVDDQSIANEGSVTVISLNPADGPRTTPVPLEILTGRHAGALAVSPDHKYVVCANAGDDTLSVLDARADTLVETVSVRQAPGDPFGAQPDALAFDRSGRRLYVANATQNAVAVVRFKPHASALLGLIPVGWFPGALAFDARHDRIIAANLKGISRQPEPAHPGLGRGPGFNTHQYHGSLSLVPVPSASRLRQLTRTALADWRQPLLAAAALPPRDNRAPVPVPERVGEPSVFQHVIYVIKENRSYDQVLGDLPAGAGDPDLCVFGERVTPNQHEFCRQFALLDNTYCSGILSADGHQWADSAMANDYVERSFAGWPRSYPAGGEADGRDALAYSPAGFIWSDASLHGRSVVDFGEFTTPHPYWRASGRPQHGWREAYQDFVSGTRAIAYAAEPDIAALRPFMVTNYPGFDLDVPDVARAACFVKRLRQYAAAGQLPNLVIIWLPDDHTSATRFGSPTPAAQVADNDLAFGQIVDAVSHSPFWTNTCIFGIEDDPQNGWDHVSAYRTTAYVISPYTRRQAVVHAQYNQTSLLRTIELMLGLPPMNQLDATATPMFDCFTPAPDFTPYHAVTNQVPLDEMNPAPKRIQDARLRQDALVSNRLPLDREDACPEDVFNGILWRAMKGSSTPLPELAAKAAGDD